MLIALAILLAAGPSFADGDGVKVYFKGSAAARRISVPPSSRPGDVIHDTGPSDPLPGPFDAILFHGKTQAGVGYEGQAGVGVAWGPWSAPEIETYSNGRFWGKFRLSGTAGTAVRIRLVNRGVAAAQPIDIYEIEAYKKSREPIEITSSSVDLSTHPGKPAVQSRESWNAAPPKYDYTLMDPGRITIHNTAGAQPQTLEEAASEMRLIQRYHQAGRGWNDIGYHFLIDGSGRVFQGRPENVVGAHVRNQNTGNVGISFMGSYHPPINDQPTAAQIKAAVDLVRWLDEAYGIPSDAIFGHRDLGPTDCPGDNLYPRIPEIKRAAAQPVPPPGSRPRNLPAPRSLQERFGLIEPFSGR